MNKIETIVLLGLAFQSYSVKEIEEFQEYVGLDFLKKMEDAIDGMESEVEALDNQKVFELMKNLLEKNVFQEG
jgi:hypothetical protein